MKKKDMEIIGSLSEINGFEGTIILTKLDGFEKIYPINTPLPIYVITENDAKYLLYEQRLASPLSELPSLTIIKEGVPITLDPAKSFILQSALSSIAAKGILISEFSIPQLLNVVRRIPDENLLDIWQNLGFNHLRHVAEIMSGEKFKIFMRVFLDLYEKIIKTSDELRQKLLRTLVEIGTIKKLNDHPDYLEIIDSVMAEKAVAVILNSSKSDVVAYIKDGSLQYGDLVCFQDSSRATLGVIKEINLNGIIVPIFEIKEEVPTTFVTALKMGMEGLIEPIEKIISKLGEKFDATYFKVPIGQIPNVELPYEIVLKANELLHFALIAISGSGKGNILKELIFRILEKITIHEKENETLDTYEGASIILFDDVGEYVKSLKPADWGLNVAASVMEILYEVNPRIHFIDVSSKHDTKISGMEILKVPVEYIQLSEIIVSGENTAWSHVIPAYIRGFYRDHRSIRPDFIENRLTIEFIQDFLNVENTWDPSDKRDDHGFMRDSYRVARRKLRNFLLQNLNYLGLEYNADDDTFDYSENTYDELPETDDNGDSIENGVIDHRLKDGYNLVRMIEMWSEAGEIVIIDESPLAGNVKLLIQRILLNHLVTKREKDGYNPRMRTILFIIEEATALMRGKESKQLQLFNEVQVRARKFGIGIGLVLQDINSLDPSLLTQLGWMIAMGLPVNVMRNKLFGNVPADLGPYDDFVKYADIGVAVGFQKLLGKNLPLPVKVNHYEASIVKLIDNLDNLDANTIEILSDELKKKAIRSDVIVNLIKRLKEK